MASLIEIRAEIAELKSEINKDQFTQRNALMIREEARSKQHRSYMQSFGLTPADRARVSVNHPLEDRDDNPFAQFMAGGRK